MPRLSSRPSSPLSRQRLLEAGYACVARHGLAKTTVEDVAKEARLSRATVYRAFPGGRDQLVHDVIAWEAARFFERLAAAVAGAPDLAATLERALLFAHRAVRDHEVLQKVLQTEPEPLLTQLTVDGQVLLGLVTGFLGPLVAAELAATSPATDPATRSGAAPAEAESAADYMARLVLSLISAPGRWNLDDPAQVADLVRTELLSWLPGDHTL